jgi:predicted Rossmann fold flavoprotein
MNSFDVVVIGAGAAGMMCAAVAGQRGLTVALLDHATTIGEKIRISGGGRCNFTNVGTRFECFVSENNRFSRFALNEYTPSDFTDLLKAHGVAYHEKHKGQLFCDGSSQQVIDVLVAQCQRGGVQWLNPVTVNETVWQEAAATYVLHTSVGSIQAKHLVVATGGLSIPKIGATDFGYRLARQFGLRIVETMPALVPLTFDALEWAALSSLSGASLPVSLRAGQSKVSFDEDLLFTHRGLSGPAVLQISSYWTHGQSLSIDLAANENLEKQLLALTASDKRQLDNLLAQWLPRRLVDVWLAQDSWSDMAKKRLAELPDKRLRELAASLKSWSVTPNGSEGYRKAEVTRGGVATEELDQKSMQAKRQPGLYFIGEVVDMTGWLGGYNFQWAWASAHSCSRSFNA